MATVDDQPNVLLFLTDQQRPDWVGMHPEIPVRTPNIERLAERGVDFSNAVCPSPLCGPSRACLASGMEYENCGMQSHGGEPTFDRDRTLYSRLRDDAGYHVMGCGKVLDKFYGRRGPNGRHRIEEFGLSDGVRNRGKWASTNPVADNRDHVYRRALAEADRFEDHERDYDLRDATRRDHFAATFPTSLPDDLYCDSWLAQNGIDLIDDAPEEKPWFLEVSFVGPHDPMDVTREMFEWYRGDDSVEFPGPAPVGADDGFDGRTHNEIRRNYAAIVENIDRWVGRYLDRLEQRGELEDTLVIFTSDHGEMLGDHGRWKKHSPYQSSVGVPLVTAGPGIESRSGRCDEPVTTLDLYATILEYAGLDSGEVDSRSLGPLLRADASTRRECVRSGLGPWRMAFDGRYKLVTGYDPSPSEYDLSLGDKEQVAEFHALDDEKQRTLREEREDILFDHATDPNETQNVADSNPDVVERLKAHL
jgi:choline-sulfatase